MGLKNQEIITAIINASTATFKDRIPNVTQLSVAEFGSAVLENEVTRNEFVNALVNRIGMSFLSSKGYKNPLAVLNKGKVSHGNRVQEIFVDLIKAQNYDADKAQNELFKRVMPKVDVIYHQLDRQDMYKITIQDDTLRQAFVEENGLQNVVNGIIESMTTSDEQDTFLLTKQLMQIYGTEGRFTPVVVPFPNDEATVKQCMVEIKAHANDLTFLSNKYNNGGVNAFTKKPNQVIFINSRFDAQVDVELLAQAFNMDLTDFQSRKFVIDDFGGLSNVVCILADENWLQIYDVLYETRSAENPQGLYRNWFLHHWQILSTSRFSNAVIFQTTTPTVTEVVLTPPTATVAKKGSLQMHVEVKGTNNPPSRCIYSVNGTASSISPLGLLYVGADETVSPLTVTAKNAFNPLIQDTTTITVV
jgi:hypothetical protein